MRSMDGGLWWWWDGFGAPACCGWMDTGTWWGEKGIRGRWVGVCGAECGTGRRCKWNWDAVGLGAGVAWPLSCMWGCSGFGAVRTTQLTRVRATIVEVGNSVRTCFGPGWPLAGALLLLVGCARLMPGTCECNVSITSYGGDVFALACWRLTKSPKLRRRLKMRCRHRPARTRSIPFSVIARGAKVSRFGGKEQRKRKNAKKREKRQRETVKQQLKSR